MTAFVITDDAVQKALLPARREVMLLSGNSLPFGPFCFKLSLDGLTAGKPRLPVKIRGKRSAAASAQAH